MAGRNALIDALQSASNTAADTVSAPVNALAWLLRKAGVPVPQNALGSSDWMAQQGLTREVPQGVPRMIGETAGLVLPMVATAKAPQIAAGLNQTLSNAQIPQRMNPQRGAIVYHGSPHKFDAFDSSKIGTGEGAQAYGHGLYLAESKNIAKWYSERLGSNVNKYTGANSVTAGPDNLQKLAQDWLSTKHPKEYAAGNTSAGVEFVNQMLIDRMSEGKTGAAALKSVLSKLEKNILHAGKANLPGMQRQYAEALDYLKSLPPIDNPAKNLYKVDLPDEQIARMLDWDKPINEAQRVPLSQAAMKQFGSGLSGTSGEHLYKEVLFEFKNAGHPNPVQAATEWLRANGAPGIRYLDGGSRNAGSGTSNFVVFPGEENALRILERNGAPLGK
jgi:hypothetical protein